MFFKTKSFAVKFIEAFGYSEGAGVNRAGRRSYHALSFRLAAEDTVFYWRDSSVRVEKGDVCFVPAGLPFSRSTKRDEVMVVHFELFGADFSNVEIFSPEDPEVYRALFAELLAVYESNRPDRDCICTSILYRILGAICCEKATDAEGQNVSLIRDAVKYMEEHYCDEALTVPYLASLCHMSEVYFRKLFQREYGTSPKKYITALRIKKAVCMLESHYFSLEEVAERTGFCDAKYFGTVFRRVTGQTPAAYVSDSCPMPSRWDAEIK